MLNQLGLWIDYLNDTRFLTHCSSRFRQIDATLFHYEVGPRLSVTPRFASRTWPGSIYAIGIVFNSLYPCAEQAKFTRKECSRVDKEEKGRDEVVSQLNARRLDALRQYRQNADVIRGVRIVASHDSCDSCKALAAQAASAGWANRRDELRRRKF